MMRLIKAVLVLCVLATCTVSSFGFSEVVRSDDGHDLELMVGRSHTVDSKERIAQVIVVNPEVADAEVISPRRIVLYGRKLGQTDVILHFENEDAVRYDLEVTIDAASLQNRLDSLFGPGLIVDLEGGVLVLAGTVDNVQEAVQLQAFMAAHSHPYIDMTSVPGVQQVLLRVRIAEVSREGLRELAFSAVVGGGSAFGGFQPGVDGQPFNPVGIRPLPNSRISPTDYVYQDGVNSVSSAATLFGGIPAADLAMYINALKRNNYLRLLAEPNLVAISGQEASFLVGGEFPIPVVQGTTVGGGSSISVEYKSVGVRLTFRPEVLGENRIRLSVAPEVSDLSPTFGGVNVSGFSVPGVIVRKSETTVELRSGQTFAIAGLLKEVTEADNGSIPLLGDLPIIGALFRSVKYSERKTELVVLVNAELVEPIDSVGGELLPGALHKRPDDWQLFVDGRLSDSVIAPLPPAQANALRKMGLDKLKGPGAWKRFDDPPTPARPDPVVTSVSSSLKDSPSDSSEGDTE